MVCIRKSPKRGSYRERIQSTRCRCGDGEIGLMQISSPPHLLAPASVAVPGSLGEALRAWMKNLRPPSVDPLAVSYAGMEDGMRQRVPVHRASARRSVSSPWRVVVPRVGRNRARACG
jgi:hypothetical protein